MKDKRNLKIVLLIFLFILLQSYFQVTTNFKNIIQNMISYFIPLIWAIFISVLMEPVVSRLEVKFKLKRIIAVLIAMIGLFLIAICFVLFLVPHIISTLKELYSIYPYILERIDEILNNFIQFLNKKNITTLENIKIETTLYNYLKGNIATLEKLSFSVALNIVWWIKSISQFVIGCLLASLIILDREYYIEVYRGTLAIIFGKRKGDKVLDFSKQSRDLFLGYFTGRLIVSITVGVIVFAIMLFSNSPYAFLIGLIFTLGNMIPIIGVFFSSIIALILLLVFAPGKIIFLIIAIIVSQGLDSFIIGPKIVGDKVGLNGFWVILSIIVCGNFFGILGVCLSVPIFCMIKIVYKELLLNVGD